MEALRGGAGSLVTSLLQRTTMPPASRLRATIATAVGCVAAALAIGGGTAAHAQVSDNGEARDFAIKLGVYMPADKAIRSASATEIPMVEGDFTIQKYPESHFNSLVSVGYLEHGGFRMIPVTVSQIYRDPNNAAGVNYYYGLGVGLYFTRLDLGDTDNRVKPMGGAFAVAGLDLTKTIFAEAKYHIIERYDSKNIGGAQLTLGLRF